MDGGAHDGNRAPASAGLLTAASRRPKLRSNAVIAAKRRARGATIRARRESKPMRTSVALLAMALGGASTDGAFAGSQQAFDNQQPSLALTLVTPERGSFPDGSASKAEGATLGFVYDFAGDFAPAALSLQMASLFPSPATQSWQRSLAASSAATSTMSICPTSWERRSLGLEAA